MGEFMGDQPVTGRCAGGKATGGKGDAAAAGKGLGPRRGGGGGGLAPGVDAHVGKAVAEPGLHPRPGAGGQGRAPGETGLQG